MIIPQTVEIPLYRRYKHHLRKNRIQTASALFALKWAIEALLMQLATTREVTSIDEEQRTAGRTSGQAIQNISFLRRYLGKDYTWDHCDSTSAEKSSKTAILGNGRSTELQPSRSTLLLLVYNCIHKYNITYRIVLNWVQSFKKGWLR